MRKIFLPILIAFLVVVFAGVVVKAQDRATSSSEARSEAADRAPDRMAQLKDKRATIAAEKKEKIKEKIRDKFRRRAHVFGEITAISATTITIETKQGSIKTIFTDSETKFLQLGKGGKKEIELTDLKVGDEIAAVGIAKDENEGLAKFVVRFVTPQVRRHAVFGEVSEIGDNQLTVSHLIQKDKPTTTVKVTAATKIKIKGKENASFSDIKVGDKVAASGIVDENGVITAKRIFVIPGKFEGAKPKSATESATPSSSTD